MSFISEKVRKIAEQHKNLECVSILQEAANTIESLSAKLQAANMECQKGNYSIGDLSELIDKFDNENIKGLTEFEQTQVFNALKYLDMYQKVGTIEKFMESKKNMERSAEDCGGWISCKDRLPDVEVSENVKSGICTDKGERFLITDTEGYVHESTFWLSAQEFEDDAIAWMPKPEPYHEP